MTAQGMITAYRATVDEIRQMLPRWTDVPVEFRSGISDALADVLLARETLLASSEPIEADAIRDAVAPWDREVARMAVEIRRLMGWSPAEYGLPAQ